MPFDLEKTLEILERTPRTLKSLLHGLSDDWLQANEGPETFSPRDVLGHLIHGEKTDWVPRLRIILEKGEEEPFEPFDRFAFRKTIAERSTPELLEELERLRAENLRTVRALSLTKEQLDATGTHPALGTVTSRQLLATWMVHDMGHLRQIARVVAHQYRGEVGPWQEYLSILSTR